MNKDFFIKILSSALSYKKVTVSYAQYQLMNECVIKLLGVSDLGKLRDRYEGNAFKENFIIQTSAEIAVEKVLDIKAIDWDKKATIKNYKTYFKVNNEDFEVVVAEWGSFPVINKDQVNNLIFAFFKVPRDVMVFGYARKESILSGLRMFTKKNLRSETNIGCFVNFEDLAFFESKEELIEVITNK